MSDDQTSKVRICGMAPPREPPKLPDRLELPPNASPYRGGFVDGFNSCLVLVKRVLGCPMSDRRSAELAVIEAARVAAKLLRDAFVGCPVCGNQETMSDVDGVQDLVLAVDALDSLPAAPAGETERVRVAILRNHRSGLLSASGAQRRDRSWVVPSGSNVVAIITADIPTKPPAVPVVEGSAEG